MQNELSPMVAANKNALLEIRDALAQAQKLMSAEISREAANVVSSDVRESWKLIDYARKLTEANLS